ncbi:hypothetical protein SCHPADRAFT_809911, partial [Schizopora paradoxa]
MRDVLDSPGWQTMYTDGGPESPYDLVFGLYTDDFRMYGMKIAGKTAKCGLIALYCMNLPPHLRYEPENIFIVAIVPGPSAPDSETISEVLGPIVRDLQTFTDGKILPTHMFPEGIRVRIRIAPVIADSPARALYTGFTGHSATYPCGFCTVHMDDIDKVDPPAWATRDGHQVRFQALVWKGKRSPKAREDEVKKNGVRWTSLHSLAYWDPVKHVVLGVMHNWLEGILEDQLRDLWGIGRSAAKENAMKTALAEENEEESFTDDDVRDSASELEGLEMDNSTLSRLRPRRIRRRSSPTPPASVQSSQNEPSVPSTRYVTLPTWVGRPPVNLGEASHGSLKANDYLVLFSFILPLVVPEFWQGGSSYLSQDASEVSRRSFENVVICTNIVCSFKTSNAEADLYTDRYKRYRRSIGQLYPMWNTKPNHHYAMHNGDIMKFWGPLPPLSEFSGERMNGTLQDINTNKKIRDMEFTMLRQMVRRG